MARYLRQNTARTITVGPFFDVTDGITPETSLTVTGCHLTLVVDNEGTPTLALDADATASSGNNDMVHITNDDAGYYSLELTAANTNYVGGASLTIVDTDVHLPVFHEFTILPANVYDSLIAGSDLLDVNTAQWLGTACATPTTNGVPEVDITHIAGSAVSTSTAQLGVNLVNIAGSAVSTSTAQLGVNVVQISSDATAADNCELMFDGTGYAGGTTLLNVNTTAISGDTTAADNCEADYDGTGYAGGTIVKGANITQISGAAVSTSTAQLGVNLVNISGSAVSTSTAQLGVNAVQISGDATASDNLEAACDGGTYNVGGGAVVAASVTAMGTGGASLNAIPWNSVWDAEVQSECADALSDVNLDHLVGTATGIPSIPAGTWLDIVMDDGTETYDRTSDSLQALRDGSVTVTSVTSGLELVRTTINTLASQTSFTLVAGSTDDDAYNGCTVVVRDSSTTNQTAVGYIADYTGSTRTVTLAHDPGIFTMATGDTVIVLPGCVHANLSRQIYGTVNDASATTTSWVCDLPSSTNDFYNDMYLTFISGSLAGQVKKVTDYVGSSKTITVGAFTAAPANGDRYMLVRI